MRTNSSRTAVCLPSRRLRSDAKLARIGLYHDDPATDEDVHAKRGHVEEKFFRCQCKIATLLRILMRIHVRCCPSRAKIQDRDGENGTISSGNRQRIKNRYVLTVLDIVI